MEICMPSKEENYSNKVIEMARIAAESALSSYGVEAICASTLDNTPLPTEDAYTGVKVEKSGSKFNISLYVIVSVGIKISEVLFSTQKAVLFNLTQRFKNSIKDVNVYAVGITVNE